MEMLRASYQNHSFAKHSHEEYVIAILESGVEEIYALGRVNHAVRGTVVVVNPGDVHTGAAAVEEGWSYRAMYPSVEFLTHLISAERGATARAPYFPTPVMDDPELAREFWEVHCLLESGQDALETESRLTAAMVNLVARHAIDWPDPSTGPGEHRAVRRVRRYIREHFAEPVRLDDLAGVGGLSPYHLIRVFQRQTGLPPHAYLAQERVRNAKLLLAHGMSIGEVAIETGFVDQSHLTRRFKKVVGVTPGEYRRGVA
jgi:AraC-like DNA-binding protein